MTSPLSATSMISLGTPTYGRGRRKTTSLSFVSTFASVSSFVSFSVFSISTSGFFICTSEFSVSSTCSCTSDSKDSNSAGGAVATGPSSFDSVFILACSFSENSFSLFSIASHRLVLASHSFTCSALDDCIPFHSSVSESLFLPRNELDRCKLFGSKLSNLSSKDGPERVGTESTRWSDDVVLSLAGSAS